MIFFKLAGNNNIYHTLNEFKFQPDQTINYEICYPLVFGMRTGHYLFLIIKIAPTSRAKVCAQWRMSLSPPPGSYLATDYSKAVVLV